MTPPRFLGPTYHPWWRRRLVVLMLASLGPSAFVVAAAAGSGDPRVTVGWIDFRRVVGLPRYVCLFARDRARLHAQGDQRRVETSSSS